MSVLKQCWLHLPEWNHDVVTESLEAGVDVILTVPELVSKIRELGIVTIASTDNGELKVPDDVEVIIINNKQDEEQAGSLLKNKKVVVRTTDWDIIPIENLIPRGGENLLTFVRNLDDAQLAVGIMEKGVAGVVLETSDPSEVRRVVNLVKNLNNEDFQLEELEITKVTTIGIGDRVCVDTCSNLESGRGMLVGNSSQGMFLVHPENIENPYVAPRPFRVNAGAVHSYVRVPGDKTRYLGELATGDPVQVIGHQGEAETVFVGRSKIEKRPMLVVFAKDSRGREHSVVLQNAETIRLTLPDGGPVSVVQLKKGDRVIGFTEEGGRHFGMAVDETIMEK